MYCGFYTRRYNRGYASSRAEKTREPLVAWPEDIQDIANGDSSFDPPRLTAKPVGWKITNTWSWGTWKLEEVVREGYAYAMLHGSLTEFRCACHHQREKREGLLGGKLKNFVAGVFAKARRGINLEG